MPRPPADRLAIEAELTDLELETLAAFCRLATVPRAEWHRIPMARDFWETLAACRIMDRLTQQGETQGGAQDRAAIMLGIEEDTLRSRVYRIRRKARKTSASKCRQ